MVFVHSFTAYVHVLYSVYNVQYIFTVLLCVYFLISPAALTSMGFSIRTIQRSAVYTTGSSLVLMCARGGLFGSQGHSSKSLCYNFCYSLLTGKLVSQVDLQSTSTLHCAITRGAGMERMGM